MNDKNRELAAELLQAEAWLESENYRRSDLVMKTARDSGGYRYVGEMWVRSGGGAILQTLEVEGPPRLIFSVDVLIGRGGARGDHPWRSR